MFENKKLLEELFIADEDGQNYIVFHHNQKTWVMPEDGLEIALNMYQPTSKKGKFLKSLVRKFGRKSKIRLCNQIYCYINEMTGINGDYFVAGYMGDTSAEDNNKVVLQVYTHKEILFYIKITRNDKVAELFCKEIQALRFLHSKNIDNVPQVLANTQIDGMNIFAQSTKKSTDEQVKVFFDKRHVDFVHKITKETKKIMPYEKTEFHDDICRIKAKYSQDKNNDILNKAIGVIENKLKNKDMEVAFVHGDYTVWNMYYVGTEMHVFDFEYCSYSKPCYIDVFHYITQMSLLGMGNNAKETIVIYEKERNLIKEYVKDPEFTYLCYLIDIIGFYDKRTKTTNKVVDKEYGQWIKIIKHLLEKIEGKTT